MGNKCFYLFYFFQERDKFPPCVHVSAATTLLLMKPYPVMSADTAAAEMEVSGPSEQLTARRIVDLSSSHCEVLLTLVLLDIGSSRAA